MKLYSKKTEGGCKTIKIMGMLIYQRKKTEDILKRKIFMGLYKSLTIRDDSKSIYVFGIRLYKRTLPVTKSQLNMLLGRVNDIYYNMQVLVKVPIVHKYLLKYKNCNIGKNIILYAGGPTFRYFDNSKCKALKCGVNGIITLVSDLNYLFVEDVFIHDKNLNEMIDNYVGNNCEKFYGLLPPRRLKNINRKEYTTEKITPMNIQRSNANVFLLEDVVRSKWATDLEVEAFGDFGGAALSALQFLLYTHPKRIYLVGNDCSNEQLVYHSDRPKITDHSAKIKSYKTFKSFAKAVYPDVRIISVNPVGLRGIFRECYTRSFLEAHPEIKGMDDKVINEEVIL